MRDLKSSTALPSCSDLFPGQELHANDMQSLSRLSNEMPFSAENES